MARASSTSSSARKDDDAPKKMRWYKQVWSVYQMTRRSDPAVTWWMLGLFLGIVAIGVVVGVLLHSVWYWTLLALPFAFLAALYTLTRRAETAAYAQIEGQPGASLSALGTIRRGWAFSEQPVAVDQRTNDLVVRGLGRAGVVLVSEGPAQRATKLLAAERKRTERVVSGAPVITIQMGDGEGQVPLRKLPRHVQKLKPTLTKAEVAEVEKRLRSLGGMRIPIPKGVDPMRVRPDRKGMRGR
jgi:hypothetical protein